MVRCTRRHGFENFAYMRYAKTLLKTFASAVVIFLLKSHLANMFEGYKCERGVPYLDSTQISI
jgi:hypothetical protein